MLFVERKIIKQSSSAIGLVATDTEPLGQVCETGHGDRI
jgi:hypothetical protein